MRRSHIVFSLIAFLGTLSFMPISLSHEPWMLVRSGKAYGISGIAKFDRHPEGREFLIVHDNKDDYPDRFALVAIPFQGQPEYFPLNWSENTELPKDLESLVAVPGQDDPPRFMAMTSMGRVYDFTLAPDNRTIALIQTFDIPHIPAGSNFEAFTLAQIQGKMVVTWAHRGEGADPAILYWGTLDLAGGKITPISECEVRVPQPTGNPRHISDLKIDRSGFVWSSAATDPGDQGPFDSGVYKIGRFSVQGENIFFKLKSKLSPLALYRGHKIEAIELSGDAQNQQIFGTDDENDGGFIRIDRLDSH